MRVALLEPCLRRVPKASVSVFAPWPLLDPGFLGPALPLPPLLRQTHLPPDVPGPLGRQSLRPGWSVREVSFLAQGSSEGSWHFQAVGAAVSVLHLQGLQGAGLLPVLTPLPHLPTQQAVYLVPQGSGVGWDGGGAGGQGGAWVGGWCGMAGRAGGGSGPGAGAGRGPLK